MSQQTQYFTEETAFLAEARNRAEQGNISPQEWREAYETIINNYEKLLKVVEVLTNQATHLENKLEKARAQLELQRKALSSEVEGLEKQIQIQQKEVNKRVRERAVLYDLMDKTRMMLIVILAALIVVVGFTMYYLFIDPDRMIRFVKELRGLN